MYSVNKGTPSYRGSLSLIRRLSLIGKFFRKSRIMTSGVPYLECPLKEVSLYKYLVSHNVWGGGMFVVDIIPSPS